MKQRDYPFGVSDLAVAEASRECCFGFARLSRSLEAFNTDSCPHRESQLPPP